MTHAHRALRRVGIAVACLLASSGSPTRAADQGGPAKPGPEKFAALAREYRELGLPLPPPDAPPMLLPWTVREKDGKSVVEYLVGFPLPSEDGNHPGGKFLVGTEVLDPDGDRKLPSAPVALDPDKGLGAETELDEGAGYFATFASDRWLSAAIQCQLSHHETLARQIVERDAMRLPRFFLNNRTTPPDKYDPTADRFWWQTINRGDWQTALAAIAWNHWLNAVVTVGTDRREALVHLEKLFAAHPELRGRERERFLESLRLTVQPHGAEPGSAEALVDALTEDQDGWSRPVSPEGVSNPNLQGLLEMGFAAMPTLLAHLEDGRLMRGTEMPIDGSPGLTRVGESVTQLVETAAGAELYPPGTKPSVGQYDAAKLARAWWSRASKVSEEEYTRTHVFPARKRADEYQWINSYCQWIVARRYPQHLGGIYERLLRERPDLDSDTVAQSIATCPGVDRDEKLRLLRLGAETDDLRQRNGAISALRKVEPAEAETRMLTELERLPSVASAARPVTSAEEEVALTVSHDFESPAVWQALEAATRRAEPSLRAKLLLRAGSWRSEKPVAQVNQRIAWLAKFFDDPATGYDERFTEEQARKTRGSLKYPRLDLTHVIGNVAAELLGPLLEVKGYPNEYISPEEWAAYRAAVREALERWAAR